MRGLERRWFRGEFGNFRWVLYNVFYRAGGAPTCLQLRSTDIPTDRNQLHRFLKMWLTWYQVVDHVCHSQFDTAKGKCSIDDSLNTKVGPFFDTPFHSSYWPRTNSTSSIKHARQPLPSIDLPPHRLRKDNIDKVRCHKLFSYNTRSIGTLYLIYLPIRSCLSTWLQDDSSSESSTPCNFPSYEPIQARVCWTQTVNLDCDTVIRFIGANTNSIPLHSIQTQMRF